MTQPTAAYAAPALLLAVSACAAPCQPCSKPARAPAAAASAASTPAPPSPAPSTAGPPEFSVTLAADAKWEQLNPARGDQSPQAATLWGDRGGSSATGFLLKPVDGFQSPPHIHNVSYRGVVISGLLHNDDPNAANMWMPTGSYWTQPKGLPHITSAKGESIMAYIEIDEGPYLVMPVNKAFAPGQVAVNVDVSNLVWLNTATIGWAGHAAEPAASTNGAAEVAFLWGNPHDDEPSGALLKLAPGARAKLSSHAATLRVVVVQGAIKQRLPSEAQDRKLGPGSYFHSTGAATHHLSCDQGPACIVYLRAAGAYAVSR